MGEHFVCRFTIRHVCLALVSDLTRIETFSACDIIIPPKTFLSSCSVYLGLSQKATSHSQLVSCLSPSLGPVGSGFPIGPLFHFRRVPDFSVLEPAPDVFGKICHLLSHNLQPTSSSHQKPTHTHTRTPCRIFACLSQSSLHLSMLASLPSIAPEVVLLPGLAQPPSDPPSVTPADADRTSKRKTS